MAAESVRCLGSAAAVVGAATRDEQLNGAIAERRNISLFSAFLFQFRKAPGEKTAIRFLRRQG